MGRFERSWETGGFQSVSFWKDNRELLTLRGEKASGNNRSEADFERESDLFIRIRAVGVPNIGKIGLRDQRRKYPEARCKRGKPGKCPHVTRVTPS